MWALFCAMVALCFVVPGGAVTVLFGALILTPELLLLLMIYEFVKRLK